MPAPVSTFRGHASTQLVNMKDISDIACGKHIQICEKPYCSLETRIGAADFWALGNVSNGSQRA